MIRKTTKGKAGKHTSMADGLFAFLFLQQVSFAFNRVWNYNVYSVSIIVASDMISPELFMILNDLNMI